jgi:hypothetical protein
MGIQCLLADSQLLRELIHRHAAESVAEEVRTCRFHNSLLADLVLSIARWRFLWAFHVNVVLLPIA